MCGGSPPTSKDSTPSPFDSFPSFTSEDEGSNRPVDAAAFDGPCEQDYNKDTADTFRFAPLSATKLSLQHLYPVLPGKLFVTVHPDNAYTVREISKRKGLFFHSGDHDAYRNYCSDFGPVDLGIVVTFCRKLRAILHDPRLAGRAVCYYTGPGEEDRANAAFILGAYLVLQEGKTPEEAWAPLARSRPSPFKMFRDATNLPSDFDLSILDCLQGLKRGADAG